MSPTHSAHSSVGWSSRWGGALSPPHWWALSLRSSASASPCSADCWSAKGRLLPEPAGHPSRGGPIAGPAAVNRPPVTGLNDAATPALELLTLPGAYVSLRLIGTINPGHNTEEKWVFLLGLFWA